MNLQEIKEDTYKFYEKFFKIANSFNFNYIIKTNII